jgi:hypothetical protein
MSEQEQAGVLEIPFTVPGGTGPLTWGQRTFWIKFMAQGDEESFNIRSILAVPSGRSGQDVADAIGALVRRHHVLVTRFPRYTTDPYQEVAEHGTIRLAVHAATADEADRVVAKVRDDTGRLFRHEDEWPVRFALVFVDGAPRHLAIAFSHLVVDGVGVWIVLDELGQLLDGRALPPTEGTWSPLALAEYEQGTEGRARSASAMRYWRNEMLECPSTIFDFAMLGPESYRFWKLRMVSSAIEVAAGRIAKLHQCSTSAVILAAVAAVLGHYTGHSRIPIQVIASNRWHPEVSHTISQIAQAGMFSVTLDDMSFGDLAKVTWKRALMCYEAAAYDPLDLERETKTVQQLIGAHIGGDVPAHAAAGTAAFFNDARRTYGGPQQPVVADTATALTDLCASTGVELDGQWNGLGLTFFLTLFNTAEHAAVDLDFDTAFIPVRTARQMLTGMESLLVQAAGRVVRLDEVGAITGIAPVARGEGWVRVDGTGWTVLAEVASLLAEVPDVVRCAVFVESAGRTAGSGRLVAYLVATRSGVTPELVHDQFCARLGGRTDVKAPQHYVLCAGPPTDDSHAAWRSRPVLVSGSGRC